MRMDFKYSWFFGRCRVSIDLLYGRGRVVEYSALYMHILLRDFVVVAFGLNLTHKLDTT